MNNQEIMEIGLFRFSLIAAIINDTYEASSKMQYYRNMAAKEHKHPNGEKVKYASETIKSWHMAYTKHGMDGLLPKKRSDSGMPRTFSRKAIEKIHDIKEQYPHITTKMVHQKLIEDGYIKASIVSLSSVYRYIRDSNLKRNQISPVERKAYEMEHSNDCWQADTTHAAKIIVDGKKVQTYLIAIIDDFSRLCLHAVFVLARQPLLNNILSKQVHESLKQRIVINYNFHGITKEEAKDYIKTRFALCGVHIEIINENALESICLCSNGSIRKLNTLVDKCLLIGSVNKVNVVDTEIVMSAQNEIELV